MRVLYKRPKMHLVQEELETVMEVMSSNIFIMLDLLIFSLIFTLLLNSVLPSFILSVLFFSLSYSFFTGLYFFFFKPLFDKV